MPVAGDVQTTSAISHIYYDLPTLGSVVAYIGAGLGVSKLRLSMPSGHSEVNETRY